MEGVAAKGYPRAMGVALAKLMLIATLLLMPFGMAGAAADAGGEVDAAMAMSHCPDAPKRTSDSGIAHCAMACSAALPAAETPPQLWPQIARKLILPGVVRQLDGLHGETATPPPKAS